MGLPSVGECEDRGDLPQRLKAVRQQVEAGNPQLYRQLALYLQVLRQVLPIAVDQASFHLATQVAPDRYAALPGLKRQALHRRLDALVLQCSSLLTVEQLANLAARLAQDQQRQHSRQQRRWLQELGAEPPGSDGSDAPDDAQQRPQSPQGSRSLPAGSVVLGFDLPLGAAAGWRWPPPAPGEPVDPEPPGVMPGFDHGQDDLSGEEDSETAADLSAWGLGFPPGLADELLAGADAFDEEDVQEDEEEDASAESGRLPDGLPWGASRSQELQAPATPEFAGWPADALWRPEPETPQPAAGDPTAADPSAGRTPALSERLSLLQAGLAALVDSASPGGPAAPAGPAPSPSGLVPLPWRRGSLPHDPAELTLWLEGFERALARRLRNLSHAINLELLRHELTSSLLPPALLDAVLAGRLETQTAPPNLLRLQLPIMSAAGAGGLTGIALLLRTGDLEAEHPKLRTCRQRLQQLRQELRRMALLHARLQRRLRIQEAERLWLQTVRRTRQDHL